MRRKVDALVALLLALAMVTAGCLGNDDDDDGNGPPPEGTTEGFTFPEFRFKDQDSIGRDSASWGGDYTIVHVIDSSEDAFEPQFACRWREDGRRR